MVARKDILKAEAELSTLLKITSADPDLKRRVLLAIEEGNIQTLEEGPQSFPQFSGQLFKMRREASGIDQVSLARKAGIHWRTVSNWENNAVDPRANELMACCILVGCRVDDVMTVQRLESGE